MLSSFQKWSSWSDEVFTLIYWYFAFEELIFLSDLELKIKMNIYYQEKRAFKIPCITLQDLQDLKEIG